MQQTLNKWLLWIPAIVLVYFVYLYLSAIVLYIILAVILAFIGRPIVNFLSEIGYKNITLPRWLASLVTLFLFGVLTFNFIWLLSPLITKQIIFFNNIDYVKVMKTTQSQLSYWLNGLEDLGIQPQEEDWDKLITKAAEMVSLNAIGSYFGSFLSLSVSILIALFSVFFITFFLLKDGNLLNQIIFASTPDKHLTKMEKALTNIKQLLSRYFVGLVFQVLLMSIVVFIGLTIVGVENALILGIIAGIFNLIPYIGPYIGAFFGIVLGITSEIALGSNIELLPFSLQIFSVFVAAQLIDNFVLQPLIFSKSVKAHPLEIFLVVLTAGTLFGIPGMIAAIPVYTILRVIAREFLPNLKFVQKLTQKMQS